MNSFGAVLETARRAKGLTQAQLAELAGVTQAAIHRYEKESREPGAETVEKLAASLGLTATFFAHGSRVEGAMAVDAHMRRQQTAKPTVWRRLEARLNMLRMHTSLLFEEVSLRAELRLTTVDPIDVSPSDAARLLRMQWRLPAGPVRSLVRWIESAGCLIIEEDFGTPRVDGLSQWVADHPVMLINMMAPTDRKRLTLAHELGHLVLHSTYVTPTMESEANEFAAEFLMPSEVIRPQLKNLTVGKLIDLKREWGVSMQALIERAHGMGLLNSTARTNLYKSLSARGWRIREPASDELAEETPLLIADIALAMAQQGISSDEAAQLAGWADAQQEGAFAVRMKHLRAVP